MNKYRYAAHVLVFSCNEDILVKMLDNCGKFVEKIYLAYSDVPWTYNKDARSKYTNSTNLEVIKRSKYYNKIEVIQGQWEKDEDQRNDCLEKAREDGFDYLIIQDADEFYLEDEYKKNLLEIEKNPDWDVYRTQWITFWKSLDYVIANNKNEIVFEIPQFALNCNKSVRFERARTPDSTNEFFLSGICYHLAYVLSDKEVERKINTWGHTHQFDTAKWYKKKWLNWNKWTRNLHPSMPKVWRKAVPYKGSLPKELEELKSSGLN